MVTDQLHNPLSQDGNQAEMIEEVLQIFLSLYTRIITKIMAKELNSEKNKIIKSVERARQSAATTELSQQKRFRLRKFVTKLWIERKEKKRNNERDQRKRTTVLELIKQKRIDLMFLQETHSDKLNKTEWSSF